MRADVHPGVGRHRHAGHAEVAIETRHPGLVVGRGADRAARALGEDQELARLLEAVAGVGDHLAHGVGLALAVDHDGAVLEVEPAEHRDAHQLLLHHEQGVRHVGEGRDDIEHALVLGGHQHRHALGQALQPAHLQLDPADHPQAPDQELRPQADAGPDRAARQGQQRDVEDRQPRRHTVVPEPVEDRP